MLGHKKGPHLITFMLVIIGGLNWLALGILQWEIGSLFGGMDALISRIIYILIGLAAVYELATHRSNCAKCAEGKTTPVKPAPPTPNQPPTPGV